MQRISAATEKVKVMFTCANQLKLLFTLQTTDFSLDLRLNSIKQILMTSLCQ